MADRPPDWHNQSHSWPFACAAWIATEAAGGRPPAAARASDAEPSTQVRVLGPLTIVRAGRALPLPASRKVRALFAYLALAPLPVTRTHLCELLWDVPNDPRGELRWCLSKVRSVVDEPGRRRVHTREDTVELDLADCFVDAAEVARAAQAGIPTLPPDRLRTLSTLFNGDFLEGLDVDGTLAFNGWLTAQRRRFRACHTALLEHLVKTAPGDEAFTHLETWLQLAPFDPHVHEILLAALARRGRIREGEDHLAATTRLFEAEGLDPGAIRDAWRSARASARPLGDGSRERWRRAHRPQSPLAAPPWR